MSGNDGSAKFAEEGGNRYQCKKCRKYWAEHSFDDDKLAWVCENGEQYLGGA